MGAGGGDRGLAWHGWRALMERFAERIWERNRHRFPFTLFVLASTFALVALLLPIVVVLGIYYETTLAENLIWGSVAAGIVVAGIGMAIASVAQTRWAISGWGKGDRSDPEGTRLAALRSFSTMSVRGGVLIVLLELAITVPLSHRYADFSPGGLVGACVFVCMIVGAGVFVIALGFHLLMRPLLREVDAEIPDGALTTAPQWSLASRFRVGILAVSALSGVVCGVCVLAFDTRDARFVATVLGALLVAGYMLVLFNFGLVEPSIAPLTDLAAAMARVRRGDFLTRVPLTSTDEVGELVATFNDMQRGLAEREALHAAFGSYVDPALAERLLRSGSSIFDGEEVEVTVVFVDVRSFTAFAERVEPQEAVAVLNQLFDVIVPVLHDHGGHANHYLGDGLLAVFGAPQPLDQHADRAVAAAVALQQAVVAALGTRLSVGIGINTGPVIAGTVGGGGRHEFTVIGDTVNVAARVEQLTRLTGDRILITDATKAALSKPRPRCTSRGGFAVPGKAAEVVVHAVRAAGALPEPNSTKAPTARVRKRATTTA